MPGRGSKEKIITVASYVSILKGKYDDPIAFFTQRAGELTLAKSKEAVSAITIDPNEEMDAGTDDTLNVGYGILKQLYKILEIDKFWNWKTRNLSMGFSVNQIFRLLVFSRILNPASKKGTFDGKGFYFEDFSLDDVYHALDIICENNEAFQKWIFEHSGRISTRDLSVSYFDCTNYYFDIGRSDTDILDDDGSPVDKDGNPTETKYRKRSLEKNHRPDPIVEMGLLIDRNGIPLAFDLFPGNRADDVRCGDRGHHGVSRTVGGVGVFCSKSTETTNENCQKCQMCVLQ